MRKLWGDYSEARGSTNIHTINSSSSNSWSADGDGAEAVSDEGATSLSSVVGVAFGQGPARALRAFVDAVDLSDGKQAAMLQNLVRPACPHV